MKLDRLSTKDMFTLLHSDAWDDRNGNTPLSERSALFLAYYEEHKPEPGNALPQAQAEIVCIRQTIEKFAEKIDEIMVARTHQYLQVLKDLLGVKSDYTNFMQEFCFTCAFNERMQMRARMGFMRLHTEYSIAYYLSREHGDLDEFVRQFLPPLFLDTRNEKNANKRPFLVRPKKSAK